MRLRRGSTARTGARHVQSWAQRAGRPVVEARVVVARFARAVRRFDIRQRDHVAALILAIGLVVGSVLGLVALMGGAGKPVALPPTPPSPHSSVASGSAPARPASSATPSKSKSELKPFSCPDSRASGGSDAPQEICIPSLRVATSVMKLGLNPDHTVQVPSLAQVRLAGWYRYSAAPGTVGPTVILGHVDSAQYGEGVFFHLSSLHAGDQVRVRRGDGKLAVFRINKVEQVSKKHFPTEAVYGPTSGPAIRLVTCGGTFDASTRNYLDNIIAYGTLLRLKDV